MDDVHNIALSYCHGQKHHLSNDSFWLNSFVNYSCLWIVSTFLVPSVDRVWIVRELYCLLCSVPQMLNLINTLDVLDPVIVHSLCGFFYDLCRTFGHTFTVTKVCGMRAYLHKAMHSCVRACVRVCVCYLFTSSNLATRGLTTSVPPADRPVKHWFFSCCVNQWDCSLEFGTWLTCLTLIGNGPIVPLDG